MGIDQWGWIVGMSGGWLDDGTWSAPLILSSMSLESRLGLNTQTEKPNHYTYLKEFRVEQCPLFVQFKCPNHKPFTCFNFHFQNQRRRRPIWRRGTFNYSPDVYCNKYDESTGNCPDNDECPYLHKTAGDTEKRYHLRYYKTCMCVYDTDSKGHCKKNGLHCAFAHGALDLRLPVLDIREMQPQEGADEGLNGAGLNNLDKERTMSEDPKWQDTTHVLACYKTEPCKKPPRLCKQGYTCPQYHNSRDRRRSPLKYKYRTTPCPNVKHGNEWGEPNNCENGDVCQYCHTRTEQQFHPEIYKSTRCDDVQQTGYCPRGVFCAFAHVDQEMTSQRDVPRPLDGSTSLATILSNALNPSSTNSSNNGSNGGTHSCSSSTNGMPIKVSSSLLMTALDSSHLLGALSSPPGLSDPFSQRQYLTTPMAKSPQQSSLPNCISPDLLPVMYHKAPGCEREDKDLGTRKRSLLLSHSLGSNSLSSPPSLRSQSAVSPLPSSFYAPNETVESVVGNALDDLNLDEINVESSTAKELEAESSPRTGSLSAGLPGCGLLGSSAPVNIPGSALGSGRNPLGNLTPPTSSPRTNTPPNFMLPQSRHDRQVESGLSASAFLGQASKFGSFSSGGFFDYTPTTGMPLAGASAPGPGQCDWVRICQELDASKTALMNLQESVTKELARVGALQKEVQSAMYFQDQNAFPDLKTLPYSKLMQLQQQLNTDLAKVEKQAMKCMVCEDKPRITTLLPCQHTVLCSECAVTAKECPYCRAQVARWHFYRAI